MRGWWASHEYSRRSVGRDIDEFPGWRTMLQLVADYGFDVMDLVDFFCWEKQDMALHYSRRGAWGLARKMKPVKYL